MRTTWLAILLLSTGCSAITGPTITPADHQGLAPPVAKSVDDPAANIRTPPPATLAQALANIKIAVSSCYLVQPEFLSDALLTLYLGGQNIRHSASKPGYDGAIVSTAYASGFVVDRFSKGSTTGDALGSVRTSLATTGAENAGLTLSDIEESFGKPSEQRSYFGDSSYTNGEPFAVPRATNPMGNQIVTFLLNACDGVKTTAYVRFSESGIANYIQIIQERK